MSTAFATELERAIDIRGVIHATGPWENIQEVIRRAVRELYTAICSQDAKLSDIAVKAADSKKAARSSPAGGSPPHDAMATVLAHLTGRDDLITSITHDFTMLTGEFDAFKSCMEDRMNQFVTQQSVKSSEIPPSRTSPEVLAQLDVLQSEIRRLDANQRSQGEEVNRRLESLQVADRKHQPTHMPDPDDNAAHTASMVAAITSLQRQVDQLQQSLLSKADVTAVGEALDLKANKASVAAALHGKANKDKIEPRLSRLEAFAEVRKESRADAPTSTAHTCGRCVCHDHCTHTPITTTPPVPPAAPAVQVIDTSDFVTKGSLRTAVSDLQTSLDAVRKELQEARSQYRQLDALVREQSVSSASKDDVSRLRRHMVTRAELNAAVSPVLEKAKTSPTVSAQPPAPLVFTPSPAPAPVSPVYQPVPITHDHTREIQQLFERMQKMQESVNAMSLDTIPALQASIARLGQSAMDPSVPSSIDSIASDVGQLRRQFAAVEDHQRAQASRMAELESRVTSTAFHRPSVDSVPPEQLQSLRAEVRVLSDDGHRQADQLNAIASSLGSIRAQQDEKWRDVEQRWARERDHHKSPEAASAADLRLTRADLSRLQSEVATHVVELSRMKIRCEQNDKSLEHVMGSLQSIGSTLSTIQRQIRTSHHDVHVHRPLTAPSQGVMMGFSYPSHRSPDPVSISSALPAPVGTVASGHGSGGMNAPRSPGCGPRLVDNSSRTHLHQHPEPFSVQHRHDRDPDAGQSEAQQPAMPTRFDVRSQTEQRVLHESSYAPAGVRTHATGTSPLADDTISPPTSDDGIALARARRYDDKPYVLAKSDAAVQTLRDNRLTGTGKSMPQRYTSHSTQTSVVVPSAHPASGENSDVVSPVPLSDSVADMINAAKAVTSSHHVASVSVDAVSPPDIPIAVPAQQHESRRGRYVSSRTVDVLPVATTTPSAIPSHHVTSSRRHRSSSSHHRPAVPTGSHITPHWITCRCRSCSRSIAVYEDEERLLRQRVRATVDKKLAGK